MRYLLAKWISRRFRPFVIIEDPELIEIFQMLFARVQIPRADTISHDVREIFAISQNSVKKLLQVGFVLLAVHKLIVCQAHPGKVHIAVDGWTLPNIYSFLGITVHFVKDSKMHNVILDFIR